MRLLMLSPAPGAAPKPLVSKTRPAPSDIRRRNSDMKHNATQLAVFITNMMTCGTQRAAISAMEAMRSYADAGESFTELGRRLDLAQVTLLEQQWGTPAYNEGRCGK